MPRPRESQIVKMDDEVKNLIVHAADISYHITSYARKTTLGRHIAGRPRKVGSDVWKMQEDARNLQEARALDAAYGSARKLAERLAELLNSRYMGAVCGGTKPVKK